MVKIKKDKLSNNINLFADIWGVNIKGKTKQIRNDSKIDYEWKVISDDYGVDYSDTLLGLLHYKKQNYEYELVLIRYKYNSFDGDTSESYAYSKNNKMPTKFEDGILVPKRFLVEYEKVWK
tara:strand:+ start:262 stop:624 length:363 start_codon:yes stop_codon:yes gene_type:complete